MIRTGTTSHLQIPGDKLLIVAGTVWALAGANILNIGLGAPEDGWALWMVAIGAGVFAAFYFGIFNRMVGKHTVRILGYANERTPLWRFFDKRSYMIMACMMTFGIGLRASGLLPGVDIAFFYAGLGSALLLAGLSYYVVYVRRESLAPASSAMQSSDGE